MQIILRKIGGEFVPLFRSVTGSSFGSRAPAGSVQRFLLSPFVLAILAVALAVAWMFVHPPSGMAMAFVGSVSIRELRAKRSTLATELRAMTDKAETEKRNLTGEEETRYSALFSEADEIRKSIERQESLADLERSLALEKPATADPAKPATEARNGVRSTPEYRKAYDAYLVRGRPQMNAEELRALSVASDAGGGFTVAPEQMATELIQAIDNVLWVRKLAKIISVASAMSLGAMTLDSDPDDADWTSEIAPAAEDASMAFAKRKLTPHPLSKLLKVSNDFLRMTQSGGESLVRERLAYKFSVPQEKAYMVGDGVQKALGIFTASADGIPTSRDVSTGNTATSMTFDGLIAAKYSLKQQYLDENKLRWVFHRDAVAQIAKLKDGNGQYLWRESVRAGEPDRILNLPLAISEYAPNTFTSGLYVGVLGNFGYYWIADALDLAIKRLDELFALTNQVGFIGRVATDGQPVLAEAFVRVKLG